ncbi:hypothetical protein SAMD00019534_115020, partial [Acytostelium subglobosum LB1]|uniref:hypothetical protein n=1 Tax=Acytostelium subglobosum LB1 TaxID=1410327 RepID=UPI0006449B4C
LILLGSIFPRLQPGLLPSSITSLKLGDLLDPPTPGDLPSSIISLEFGSRFNYAIGVGVLPSSLQTLRFGLNYNQPINPGVLPQSLQSLYFVGQFNQPFGLNVLPPQLATLSLMSKYDKDFIPGSLPNSLVTLAFGNYRWIYLHALSTSLTSLTYESKDVFTVYDTYKYDPIQVSWPQSLQTLVVGNLWHHGDNHDFIFPPQLHGHQPLPSSLTSLSIQLEHQQHLALLSQALTRLDLGHQYDCPIPPGSLPSSLVHLTIGNSFNQVLPEGALPASLVDLSLGDKFNHAMPTGVLPPTLTSLSLGRDYKQSVKQTSLPGTLKILSVDLRTQDKYFTSPPSSSSECGLELFEIRSLFIWQLLAPKSKGRATKVMRTKQYLTHRKFDRSKDVAEMVVSFPNVHTFDVNFYLPNKNHSFEQILLQTQMRRINELLVICLYNNL